MWWKLLGLFLASAALIFAVIPIRTHAVMYDPATDLAPQRITFGDMPSNMYLTAGTVLFILCIVTVAGFVALKIVRGRW